MEPHEEGPHPGPKIRVIWAGNDVEIWSPDDDGDYRIVILGAASRFISTKQMRRMALDVLIDFMSEVSE
jgi:hypothetical protein